ncbi:2818_t:CDS:2 [Gigaspora margarita]|uniref:2818_t:CDS:1 n=1 Tax=Gigaspora margarita TaxID=4874 RepID=A0ABM8W4Y4_GIGMA|nr:2818_t:CDS:2 [Gigaspora margarita]
MLTKEIITYTICYLSKIIVINDRPIKQVNISSHCDKHEKEGITKEKITELVKLLNNRYFPFSGRQETEKNYFKFYPVLNGKRNNLSEEVIAERLDLDKFTTAKLLRGYVESFALDSLISYVEKLHLPLQVKITSEERRQNEEDIKETTEKLLEETIASGSGNPATADNKGGQKLKDQKATSKTAKVFTVEGLKLVCKTGSKIIPVVGNIVGAVDDIYQSYQIGSLEETTASLRNVQSTMEGQIEDLQAGLKEAKDRELQLAQDHKNLQDQLNKSNTETKTELELQKQALEEAISANNATKEQLQTSIEATQTQIDEVKNRMNDSEKAIEILQSTSLSHEEKITNLNSLIEKEKERINAFETKMDSFEDQLNDQQKQLDTHQKKISQLHQAHLDLEKQVEENKNNIRHNSTNINLFSQNLREQIQKQNQLEEEQRRMKWEAQEKARKDKEIAEKQAKLQKEIQANQTRTQKVEKELDQLKTEIRQKEFSQQKTEDKLSKLIKYTQLKEERQTLRKQLAQYADLPDSKEYFKQFEKPIIEAKEQIALQYEAHED